MSAPWTWLAGTALDHLFPPGAEVGRSRYAACGKEMVPVGPHGKHGACKVCTAKAPALTDQQVSWAWRRCGSLDHLVLATAQPPETHAAACGRRLLIQGMQSRQSACKQCAKHAMSLNVIGP